MSCLFEDLADDETVDINCSGRTFIRLFVVLLLQGIRVMAVAGFNYTYVSIAFTLPAASF